MNKFRTRKFILACFFALAITAGWLQDKLNGDQYLLGVSSILLLYSKEVFTAMFGKKDNNDV